jgi:hypothetical protein
MKTMFLILVLFCTTYFGYSQGNKLSDYKSSANIIYQTSDYGIGLRFETHNIYASVIKGTYKYPCVYIKNHVKYALGYYIPFEYAYLTAGLTYHTYSKPIDYGLFNRGVLKPISFELGFLYKYKRFNIGCSTDVLKWDGSILLGFNF